MTTRHALAVIGVGVALIVSTFSVAPPALGATGYALRRVVSAERPVGIAVPPGSSTILVIEQTGRLRPLVGTRLGSAVLDVAAQVSTDNEQGLLGVAWSPDASRLYVDLTNTDGDTEVREYRWADGRADPGTMRLLLRISQPFPNHNGGQLAVGPDGLLWIGMGDGGSANDPGNRAQNPHELLGKLLRIDPRADLGRPYRIPVGNPFPDGVDGAPEVWALGLRNPWRFTLDWPNRRVIVGDVGQGDWEEIDVIPLDQPGVNLGWNDREGTHAFQGRRRPAGALDPVYEYSHQNGCSVIGGPVYRGRALPELRGSLLFGDYCKGWIAALRPGIGSWTRLSMNVVREQLTSFGVGPDGEVWVTEAAGGVFRLVRR